MEFKKERVFTAVNADELEPGDRVIVADTIASLMYHVRANGDCFTIHHIENDDQEQRFSVLRKYENGQTYWGLAYLVERAENCTNCKFKLTPECNKSKWPEEAVKLFRCVDYEYETEQKAEPHYRPFKDTDELIKVWDEKCQRYGVYGWQDEIEMPLIWVRHKGVGSKSLITDFVGDIAVIVGTEGNGLQALFDKYTFLDGSICGVEE